MYKHTHGGKEGNKEKMVSLKNRKRCPALFIVRKIQVKTKLTLVSNSS